MTAGELSEKIEGLIISGNEAFAVSMGKVQNSLYNRLVLSLKDLEVDQDGYILQSATNRKVLSEAVGEIDAAFAQGTPYTNSIERHIELIPSIDKLNEAYFETISSGFTPNKNYIKSLQRNTIRSLEENLLSSGLESQIKSPLVNILNQNVNSGGSFSGFMNQVRDFVKGNEKVEGRLLVYAKTYLKDALFSYSRAYQQAVTADLKLEWYIFLGPVIPAGKGSEGSRGWCLEKKGRYFHQREIESWADEEWRGKKPGTTKSSIFINVGGWQCVDQLIPVHQSIVPKSDKDRITK
jgi:hypothetical protein